MQFVLERGFIDKFLTFDTVLIHLSYHIYQCVHLTLELLFLDVVLFFSRVLELTNWHCCVRREGERTALLRRREGRERAPSLQIQ